MSISGTFSARVGLSGTQLGSNDLTTPSEAIAIAKSLDFTNGTGASQINKIWLDQRTLTASSTENLDLAASLIDSFGNTLTFTIIKGIYVYAATANTNNVNVGGAASNTFLFLGDATDIVPVKPGGVFLWVAPATGATVTATTGDILKVANSSSGTSVTYDIAVFGLA
jgi:hypothetical protein